MGYVGRILSAQTEVHGARPEEGSFEGVVIAGSYDKTNGTCYVTVGETAAIFSDSGDLAVPVQVYLASSQIGDQTGPVGNERVQVFPTQSGYIAHFEHNVDDAPQAPAGERWMLHRSAKIVPDDPPQWDGGVKFTNDGHAEGDGLGGTQLGLVGAYTAVTASGTTGLFCTITDAVAQTHTIQTPYGHTVTINDATHEISVVSGAGHQVTMNDTQQTILIQTVNGLEGLFDDATQKITHQTSAGLGTVIDAAGKAVSLVATESGAGVGVGKLLSALDATENAATRFSDLDSAIRNQITQLVGNGIIQLLTAIVSQNGIPNGASATAILATLASGGLPGASFFSLPVSLHNITTPACSPIVRIA